MCVEIADKNEFPHCYFDDILLLLVSWYLEEHLFSKTCIVRLPTGIRLGVVTINFCPN